MSTPENRPKPKRKVIFMGRAVSFRLSVLFLSPICLPLVLLCGAFNQLKCGFVGTNCHMFRRNDLLQSWPQWSSLKSQIFSQKNQRKTPSRDLKKCHRSTGREAPNGTQLTVARLHSLHWYRLTDLRLLLSCQNDREKTSKWRKQLCKCFVEISYL